MGRTQIYLGEDELSLLDRAARATGASRSELIRRAVRESFGASKKANRRRALAASASSSKEWSLTGAEHVASRRIAQLEDELEDIALVRLLEQRALADSGNLTPVNDVIRELGFDDLLPEAAK